MPASDALLRAFSGRRILRSAGNWLRLALGLALLGLSLREINTGQSAGHLLAVNPPWLAAGLLSVDLAGPGVEDPALGRAPGRVRIERPPEFAATGRRIPARTGCQYLAALPRRRGGAHRLAGGRRTPGYAPGRHFRLC